MRVNGVHACACEHVQDTGRCRACDEGLRVRAFIRRDVSRKAAVAAMLRTSHP